MNNSEWSELKRESNLSKHYLDFIDAIKIFEDNNRIEAQDNRKNYSEIRYQTIGKVNDIIIFVVWTYRKNNKRIISARKANNNEREKYYELKNK
ncbi:BrnT family toxin [Candidatus Margulisiibacteriota bacterium]